MAEESDRELWPRIQLGDTAAFDALFDRHAGDVYNFVFRRTASWDVAEEMTSAVFLEAWRRRTEVVPDHETLRPWLFGVALNLLRNRARSMRRRGVAEARLQIEEAPDDPAEAAAGDGAPDGQSHGPYLGALLADQTGRADPTPKALALPEATTGSTPAGGTLTIAFPSSRLHEPCSADSALHVLGSPITPGLLSRVCGPAASPRHHCSTRGPTPVMELPSLPRLLIVEGVAAGTGGVDSWRR
jgi:RNA polymerase sigma factor (sigma-70 family)